jgi:predicted Zn-dependent peptidase
MALFACGDLHADELAGRLEGAMRSTPSGGASARPRPAVPPAVSRQVRQMATSQPRLTVAVAPRAPQPQSTPLLRRELCLDLALDVLFGASSTFFARHYEGGLIDGDSFGYEVYVEEPFTFCLIGGDTPDPDQLEEEILEQLGRARDGELVERGFDRAMRKAWGHLVCEYDAVEGCAAMTHHAVTRGGGPFDILTAHREVTLDEVMDCLLGCLDPSEPGVASVLPVADTTPQPSASPGRRG